MSKKLKELLKHLDFPTEKLDAYLDGDEDLKPEEDAETYMTAIREQVKNELPDVTTEVSKMKPELEKQAKGLVYNSLLRKLGKAAKLDASKYAEGRSLDEFIKDYNAAISGRTNDDVSEIQEQLHAVEASKTAMERDIQDKLLAKEQEIETFKSNWFRDEHIIEQLGTLKNLKVSPKQTFSLIKDKLYGNYNVTKEGAEYELREKGNPAKRVSKSKTEFLKIPEALQDIIDKEGLLGSTQQFQRSITIPETSQLGNGTPPSRKLTVEQQDALDRAERAMKRK